MTFDKSPSMEKINNKKSIRQNADAQPDYPVLKAISF